MVTGCFDIWRNKFPSETKTCSCTLSPLLQDCTVDWECLFLRKLCLSNHAWYGLFSRKSNKNPTEKKRITYICSFRTRSQYTLHRATAGVESLIRIKVLLDLPLVTLKIRDNLLLVDKIAMILLMHYACTKPYEVKIRENFTLRDKISLTKIYQVKFDCNFIL